MSKSRHLSSGTRVQKKTKPASLWSRLIRWHQIRTSENRQIDGVVDIVEPKIKRLRGYRNRLREPVRICRAYGARLVGGIPGPVRLSRSDYDEDPTVHACFAGADHLAEFLSSTAAQGELPPSPGQETFGLMTMTRTEKTIFGRKMQDNMMLGDVAMRSVNFIDHAIVGHAENHEALLKRLEQLSLEVLAESALHELSARKTLIAELRDQKLRLTAMAKMFGFHNATSKDPTESTTDTIEKRLKVNQLLEETKQELALVQKSSSTPRDWLALMASHLAKPQQILTMDIEDTRLNWKNVMVDATDGQSVVISLAHFELVHELNRSGVLVSFNQYP